MYRPTLYRLLVVGTAAIGAIGLAACGPKDKVEAPSENTVVINETTTAPAMAITGEWASLQPLIGQYPRDSGLFDNSAITPQLKALLGDKFDAFVTNMQVQSPLAQQGNVLFTTGNKQHEGGSEMAYLLVDPTTKALEVGLWQQGKLTTYATQNSNIPKPEDVQALISNSAG